MTKEGELRGRGRRPPGGGNPSSSAKKRHSGLTASINSIFHLRCQFLICFSRVIAACIVPASSNQTSVLTGGEASDYTTAEPLMAIPVATLKALLADKGYDGDRFRESLLVRGIPPRSNRKVPEHPDYPRYKVRNRVERMFSKLKQQRRIATRYGQNPALVRELPQPRRHATIAEIFCQHDLNQTENPPALRRFELAASTFLPCGVSAHFAPCFTTSPSVTSSSRIGSVGSCGRRFDRPSSVERCGWLRMMSFCFSVIWLALI
uniref:transposase n=1 Tax=Sphingopyxis bauzanensis TaxID=651663 RepID=UPI0013030563|nr:transposase [Sphingopyxis bauzanensis]